MTVLLACALGSRYSDDPRVMVTDDDTGLSAGWNYFVQVPFHRKRIFYETTVYDLQYYAVYQPFSIVVSRNINIVGYSSSPHYFLLVLLSLKVHGVFWVLVYVVQ